MTQEQKDRNIRLAEALESGKYTQATGRLRNKAGYCCLGVACDLAIGELGIEWSDYSDYDKCFPIEKSTHVAPPSVCLYYGWTISNPALMVEGLVEDAAIHNDGSESCGLSPKTFPQIAQGFRKLAADSPLEAS